MYKLRQFRRTPAFVTALIFALFGVTVILQTHAANVALGIEPENGAISSPVAVITDTNASGGKGVKFGNSIFGFMLVNNDITKFQEQIDIVASNHLGWGRIGVNQDAISTGGSPTSISWNASVMSFYDNALAYAQSKGVKITLSITGAPGWAAQYSQSDYQGAERQYLGYLANRWRGKVPVWQVFNESDTSSYQNWDGLSGQGGLTPAYLANESAALGVARQVIKSADPAALITTNITGWPIDDTQQARWFNYFDALQSNLDMISLDLYPGSDPNMISIIGSRVTNMKQRYNKPVAVTEAGLPTGINGHCWSEQEQATFMPQAMRNLKAAGPMFVTYYELRDGGPKNSADCEDTFGVMYNDMTPKPGFNPVISAMQ